MIYQILRGQVTPITWAFDDDERTINLHLETTSGDRVVLPVVSADLAENIGRSDFILYIMDHCQWKPRVVIDNDADVLQSQDCSVQVYAEPDPPYDFLLPLESAYLVMYPEPPTPLSAWRDQHVIPPPHFDQRPDGTDYLNSDEWYLTAADRAMCDHSNIGPRLKFLGVYEPTQSYIWLQYITQPQAVGSYWGNAHSRPIRRDYHPTVVRIDVKDGYAGTFHPIQWHISKTEYAAALRVGYLAVHAFVVDILGNCSFIARDIIAVNPPISRYYPEEDINLRRRVQRYRGPRESWKQIVTGDETTYSINKVLGGSVGHLNQNVQATSDQLWTAFNDLYTSLQHIRSQRGQL